MENPIKMDDLGVPLFLETPIRLPSLKLTVSLHLKMDGWKVPIVSFWGPASLQKLC